MLVWPPKSGLKNAQVWIETALTACPGGCKHPFDFVVAGAGNGSGETAHATVKGLQVWSTGVGMPCSACSAVPCSTAYAFCHICACITVLVQRADLGQACSKGRSGEVNMLT